MIKLGTITLYKSSIDVKGSAHYNLDYILDIIKNGGWGLSDKISHLRTLHGEDYKNFKQENLPMFVGGGDFSYRSKEGLVNYSNILILDFDWPEDEIDKEKILSFKQHLIINANSYHLYAVWLSPGHGIKAVLIHDNQSPEFHYDLFGIIKQQLFPTAPLDENCSDVVRSCYLSYDPDLFVNQSEELKPFHFDPSMIKEKRSAFAPEHKSIGGSSTFVHTEGELKINRIHQSFCSDKKLMNYLKKSFDANDPDYYKDGHRHKEIKRRAVIYVKDGILFENAVWSLVGQFGEGTWANLGNEHIKSLIASIYNIAREDFGKERSRYLSERIKIKKQRE